MRTLRVRPKSAQKLLVSARYSPEVAAYSIHGRGLAAAHGQRAPRPCGSPLAGHNKRATYAQRAAHHKGEVHRVFHPPQPLYAASSPPDPYAPR